MFGTFKRLRGVLSRMPRPICWADIQLMAYMLFYVGRDELIAKWRRTSKLDKCDNALATLFVLFILWLIYKAFTA